MPIGSRKAGKNGYGSMNAVEPVGGMKKGVFGMEEKAYKAMGKTGAFNLVLGICTMVAGIAVGIVMIIHGAKLLKSRKNIMF